VSSTTVQSGGSITSPTTVIAHTGAGTSNFTVTGNNSVLNSPNLTVGSGGTGVLNISNSGTVTTTTLSINSTSNINLNGGTLRFNTIGGTGGLSRINYTAGTIQLAGNRDLASDPVFLNLFAGGTLIPAGKGLFVEGSASVGAPVSPLLVNGGTLTAQNGISVGATGGTGVLEITNGGIVNSAGVGIGNNLNTSGKVTISGPGSTWIINGGLTVGFDGARSGVLTIRDGGLVHVANLLQLGHDDFINLEGGTIRFDSYFNWNVGGGGVGKFNFHAGTLQLAGNRTIGTENATLDPILDTLGPAPTLTANKGLTIEGTATLQTIVTLDGGTFTAGQLANGYNLRLQRGTLHLTSQALTIAAGGLLGNTLDLNDDMTVNVNSGITNQGLVTGDGQIGGSFTNAAAGELRGEPGKSLKLTGIGNNSGRINLHGGLIEFTSNLNNNTGAFISGNGTLKANQLTNSGTMNFAGTTNIFGVVNNVAGGKVISGGGGATIFYGDVTNNGEIRTSTNGFTVFFGSVSGSGSFTGTGTVNFEGDLSPGNSPAAVNFGGNLALGVAASLVMELAGTTPGSGYDQVKVAGALALDGTLSVVLAGLAPAAGQSFDVLDWGSISGTFDAINLPTLGGGLTWNTSQLYSSGLLSIAAAGLPGDYNGNGVVDGADYVVWRKGLGTTYTQADYNLWRSHFGQTGSGSDTGVNAIPESATVALLAIPAAGWCVRRRRA
jgi:T5SS/PEP-CTERM-associated repeat protein